MKKKIFFFLTIFFFLLTNISYTNDIYPYIQPEIASEKINESHLRYGAYKKFVVVTANDYATKIGYKILKKGGTVVDAAIAIQLTLGLVEPQSSGLGGGLFMTYYNKKTGEKLVYEGRERAPSNMKSDVFLDDNGMPKDFFKAAIGGASVGVPSTLKTLHEIHNHYGKLQWEEIIKPVIELSEDGFFPPKRLVNALKKEKFLFDLYPNSIFKQIIENPEQKFKNHEYTQTLIKISKNFLDFYNKDIATKIVQEVRESKNPGSLSLKDLRDYKPQKTKALCFYLRNNFELCGPNLPSSGTICIIQALIIFEDIFSEKLKTEKNFKPDLNEILDILDFIYSIRDQYLADQEFEEINVKDLLDRRYLIKSYKSFKKNKTELKVENFDEIFSSTSHFSLVDNYQNVLSVTSSIESSFGSRLFTNGFFLNNQLTDFSFSSLDNSKELIKNRPEAKKRPLSSMSPIIIFDKKKDFFLTVGSPGGKAIIAYVFKALISVLFLNLDIFEAIENPNYIKIKGKTFIENVEQNKTLINKGMVRELTSGLAIIANKKNGFLAVADPRRDGSVRGN